MRIFVTKSNQSISFQCGALHRNPRKTSKCFCGHGGLWSGLYISGSLAQYTFWWWLCWSWQRRYRCFKGDTLSKKIAMPVQSPQFCNFGRFWPFLTKWFDLLDLSQEKVLLEIVYICRGGWRGLYWHWNFFKKCHLWNTLMFISIL